MRSLLLALPMIMTIISHAAAADWCYRDGQSNYDRGFCAIPVATGASEAITPTLDLEEGLAAFEKRQYDLALRKLNPLAEAGIAMAQNILGRMYLKGQGVRQDYNQALILFHKAASQGLPNAQNNLGVVYAAGAGVQQDYTQAVAWFKEAANQGYAPAMDNLADMYMKGFGVKPDKEEARRWREKAISAGFAGKKDPVKVQTVGSSEYEKGLEFYYKWEFEKASKLFLLAAEKGHPEAQLRIGLMYQRGQGIQKDEIQAQHWIQKAKMAGHTLEDNRDRVLIIDTSKETIENVPQPRTNPTKGVCAAKKGSTSHKC